MRDQGTLPHLVVKYAARTAEGRELGVFDSRREAGNWGHVHPVYFKPSPCGTHLVRFA